jgi:flagellar basal body-associated protein FliL
MSGVTLGRTVCCLVMAGVLSTPWTVLGQTPAAPTQAPTQAPPATPAKRPAALTNAELGQLLDAYAIVQAQNALQLNDDQYGRFVSRLNRLQETRRRNTQARNRLMQQLRKLAADQAADETGIREQLKALRDLEEQSAVAIRRDYEALYEVLDARQQVRFRVFEEQLERRRLDLLMRARARARPAPQGRNGGGRDDGGR